MILFINSFKKTPAIMVGALVSLLIVGCGSSYRGVANGGDGIYESNNANNRAVIRQGNTTANSDSYFTKKLEEYEQAASSGDVLTDVEGYSSEYYGGAQDEYQSGYEGENYQAWGENAQQSSQVYGNVGYNNYNNNYYPFWNRGYRNNYGYGSYGYGYGYYGGGPFYNNYRYGWGGNLFLYGGFYGGAFFGNSYGYRRGYYNNRIVRRSNNRRAINSNARRSLSTRNSSARSTNNRRVYSSRQSSARQSTARQSSPRQSSARQSSSVRRSSGSTGQSNRSYSRRGSSSSSNRSYSPRSSSNRGSSSARSSRSSSRSSSGSRTYRRR